MAGSRIALSLLPLLLAHGAAGSPCSGLSGDASACLADPTCRPQGHCLHTMHAEGGCFELMYDECKAHTHCLWHKQTFLGDPAGCYPKEVLGVECAKRHSEQDCLEFKLDDEEGSVCGWHVTCYDKADCEGYGEGQEEECVAQSGCFFARTEIEAPAYLYQRHRYPYNMCARCLAPKENEEDGLEERLNFAKFMKERVGQVCTFSDPGSGDFEAEYTFLSVVTSTDCDEGVPAPWGLYTIDCLPLGHDEL